MEDPTFQDSFDASTNFPCIEDKERNTIRTIVYERDCSTEQDEPGYIRHAHDIEYEILLTFKRTPQDFLLNSYMTATTRELIWQDLIPLIDSLRYRLLQDAPTGIPCWITLATCSADQTHPLTIPIGTCSGEDMDFFWFSARDFIVNYLFQNKSGQPRSFRACSLYMGIVF